MKLFFCSFTCRDEQYHLLWNELEMIASKYSQQSEQHRMLYDYICHAVSQSASCQNTKALLDKKEEEMGGGGGGGANKSIKEEPVTLKSQAVASNSKGKGARSSPYPIPGIVMLRVTVPYDNLNSKACCFIALYMDHPIKC